VAKRKRPTEESPQVVSRITIPTIGSDLILAEPWAFMLFHERRNRRLLETLSFNYGQGTEIDTGYTGWNGNRIKDIASEVVLPTGTRLKVARIYIKNGTGNYDSVTFTMKRGNYPGDKKKGGRFWAKLNDVNRIICTWDEETVKRFTQISPLTQLAAEAASDK
jgi:hypothetical protein